MKIILFHDALAAGFDFSDTLFSRDDISVARASSEHLIRRCLEMRPEVVVLGDRGDLDPIDAVEEMRSHPDLDHSRVLLVLADIPGVAQRDALAANGIRVVKYPARLSRLADEIADLLAVETRVAVRAPVLLEVQGKSADGLALFGQILDLSAGGFRLRTAAPLRLGEVLFAAFRLPDMDSPLYMSGKVARAGAVTEHGYEYGFCFADVRERDRERIASFVGERRGLVVLPEIENADASPRLVAV